MKLRAHRTQLFLPAIAIALTMTYALGASTGGAPPTADFEYRIAQDVDEDELEELAEDGWEYVGYLGRGVKGQANDETLWRKPR